MFEENGSDITLQQLKHFASNMKKSLSCNQDPKQILQYYETICINAELLFLTVPT
jgi:hypothetical protein